MIITVTLNVAIDKAYVIDRLEKSTVMRVKQCKNTPGGKGLNVAKVVDLCGEEVLATGVVGGFNGKSVVNMLDEYGVKNDFMTVKNETRCCINVLAADNSSTEFLEPGAPVDEVETERFIKHFEGLLDKCEVVTISGSVPAGVPTNIYAKLIELCKSKNVPVCLDTSGKLLQEGIKAVPTLIKPNNDEIEALLGIKVQDFSDVLAGARKLHEQGIKYVVVSLGADGALLICDEGEFVGKPPKIKTVNTVGCGDSMLAAFAVGLKKGQDAVTMLKEAIAVSAANALTMATGSFEKEDYENLLPEVIVETL